MTRSFSSQSTGPPQLLAGFGLFLLVLLIGCGGEGGWDVERCVVSGAVTYDGQPIQEGLIRFVPEEGTVAPASAVQIQNGKYTIDAEGGVPVGTHRVEIEAYRDDPKGLADGEEEIPGVEGPPQEQFIPEKYNRASELKATVEGKSPVTKDFELTK